MKSTMKPEVAAATAGLTPSASTHGPGNPIKLSETHEDSYSSPPLLGDCVQVEKKKKKG